MAGIGFELKKLSRQETLSSVLSAGGHAAVIAAGPWLFTIASLAAISISVEPLVGLGTLATFRAVIIYAFATSLVLTAPVSMVATRLVADALWSKRPEDVRALLFAAFGLAAVIVLIGVVGLSVYFALPLALALAFASSTMTVAMIWIALGFCGAVRDYGAVTRAFLAGLLAAVAATIAAAGFGLGAPAMVLGFSSGLLVTFLGLCVRVMATFPHPECQFGAAWRNLLAGFTTYRSLAVGALAGTTAVWVDKWVFWFSPVGESVAGGLVHAPLYDSAMFISSLVIIPSLASFVAKLETDFFDRYQRYYGSIKSHGTIQQIENARQQLSAHTLDTLVLITIAQVGMCAVLIMTAPMLVQSLNLQFRQIAILRFGALAAVFHFVFIASTSFLLFFDRRWLYLGLQLMFFGLNLALTILTVYLGQDYYGVGYFGACLISSFVAYILATNTFRNLNFLTFIGNNPSIKPGSAYAKRSWWGTSRP
jgi:polysaccharide biosynthesis protein PelG